MMAGEHAASQQAGAEACSFFIGPVDDAEIALERMAFVFCLKQAIGHFKGRHDAERPVDPPGARLAIEMRAHHHGRSARRSAQVEQSELVSDGIDDDVGFGQSQHFAHPVAGRAIGWRCAQPRYAPAG